MPSSFLKNSSSASGNTSFSSMLISETDCCNRMGSVEGFTAGGLVADRDPHLANEFPDLYVHRSRVSPSSCQVTVARKRRERHVEQTCTEDLVFHHERGFDLVVIQATRMQSSPKTVWKSMKTSEVATLQATNVNILNTNGHSARVNKDVVGEFEAV